MKIYIFKIKRYIMLKQLLLLIFLLPTIIYAFNETEAIERPVTFASGMLDGIMSFVGSTIGWWALLFLAVGFATIIIAVGKSVRDW
jgi:hypothetical protein